MFVPIKLYTHVELRPAELDADWENRLRAKLRAKLEGVCSTHGYVKPGTLEIVRRSVGHLDKAHFNGNIRYYFACRAEVCNPPTGSVVDAKVRNKNQLGVLADTTITIGDHTHSVLEIVIPRRSAGIVSEVDLDSVKVGQTVHVEVMGKRFQMNDRKIYICGRLVKKGTSGKAAVAASASAANKPMDTDADADADGEVDLIEGGDADDEVVFETESVGDSDSDMEDGAADGDVESVRALVVDGDGDDDDDDGGHEGGGDGERDDASEEADPYSDFDDDEDAPEDEPDDRT